MKVPNNFTPGPSQLYFTVEDHMRKAFREGIPSLSHRSKQFEQIFRDTTEGLRQLLAIPSDHCIVFASSATEIWERIIQNLTQESSYHFVNGAFSQRFYETAIQLGRKANKTETEEGKGFSSTSADAAPELIALTQNETSTGVSLPQDFINDFRSQHPQAIIAVDAVSSLPYPAFDFKKVDTVFFSVQKGFGLPAGLGVWIVNEACISKSESLHAKGLSIGSYHSLPGLVAHAKKYQTPETPNVLGIYLLGQVIQDMLRKGITALRKETEYKATVLYQTLEQHQLIKPFVTEKQLRSQTVIVAETGSHTKAIAEFLMRKGLSPGDGYGKHKGDQLRFANFPAHSKELYELLMDLLLEFTG